MVLAGPQAGLGPAWDCEVLGAHTAAGGGLPREEWGQGRRSGYPSRELLSLPVRVDCLAASRQHPMS